MLNDYKVNNLLILIMTSQSNISVDDIESLFVYNIINGND